ncbi:hypothetical protein BGY98DRAFT_283036 [Russula aff. rugulosa BPL654]|nr:hypothetical protein BGY98DRAFT_283036 [Russula aff. rugulosa BPL654]
MFHLYCFVNPHFLRLILLFALPPYNEPFPVVGYTVAYNKPLQHTPSKPLVEVKNIIHQILQRYSPTIQTLVTEARRKSFEYYSVLINGSGSGKTRQGLHDLCQDWGFYGVTNQVLDGTGSEDFWQFMALNNYRLVKNYGGHKDEAALHMHQEARHRVMQFLLSRFLLLNTLIMEALKCEGGWCPSDHRLLWVLLQVRPTDMLEDDASKELFEALRIASVEDLEVQIKEEYSKLKLTGILDSDNHPVTGEPMYQPLYCFLDEI